MLAMMRGSFFNYNLYNPNKEIYKLKSLKNYNPIKNYF